MIKNQQEYIQTKQKISLMIKEIKKLKKDLKDKGLPPQSIKQALNPQITFLLGFVDEARFYQRSINKKKD